MTLAVFDLLEPVADFDQLSEELYTEQIMGYYDKQDKSLHLISDQPQLGPWERLTLAHELTHALQDQQFDLEKISQEENHDLDSEAAYAFTALVKGDASLLESQYMESYLVDIEHPIPES